MSCARCGIIAVAVAAQVVILFCQATIAAGYDNVVGGPPGGTSQWHIIFQDEFNGARLDSSKWNTSWAQDDNSTGGRYWGDEQWAYYGDNNIQVKNGNMELITRREKPSQSPQSTYTTGVLQSHGKFSFTFGYMEARVNIPKGKGLWGAFWAISEMKWDWPPEIDVFENPYDDYSAMMYQTWHPENNDQVQVITNSNNAPWFLNGSEWGKEDGDGFLKDYHIYAANWTPDSIYMYIDGIQTMATTYGVAAIRNRKMYLIFDMIIVGGWGPAIDETCPLPATMYTDWVRVWQKGKTGDGTSQIQLYQGADGLQGHHWNGSKIQSVFAGSNYDIMGKRLTAHKGFVPTGGVYINTTGAGKVTRRVRTLQGR